MEGLLKDRESLNRHLFYEFLLKNGFVPEYYKTNKGVLEVMQTVSNSLSQYLKDYRQFLVSSKVDYEELEKNHIKGARGELDIKKGIQMEKIVPPKFYNKEKVRVIYPTHEIICPSMEEFDTIIAYNDWKSCISQIHTLLVLAQNYPDHEKYLGFIADKKDVNLYSKVGIYKSALECLNRTSTFPYELIHEENREEQKELYLIKKAS